VFSGSSSDITYAEFEAQGVSGRGVAITLDHVWGNLTMKPGWLGDGNVQFVILGELEGANGQKVYGMTMFQDHADYFGINAACKVYFGTQQQYHHTIVKVPFANGSLPQYHIGMYYKQDGTILTVYYYIAGYITPNEGLNFGTGQNYDITSWVWTENFTVPSDFSDHTTFRLYVGWKGSGQGSFAENYDFSAALNATVVPVGTYNRATGTDQSKTVFGGIIDFLRANFDVIVSVVTMFVGAIKIVLPVLPMLAIIYFVDMIITSFQTGSFTPVGAAFAKLWELILAGYYVIVRLGQLIWDAITFWK